MVLILLFLPFFVISELRRANHASHCYFYHMLPDTLLIEKFFRTRTHDFSSPLLQYNADQPTLGVLEVSLFALKGLAASLLASCTNRKNRRWQPTCFKFELQVGDVVYCSNPHKVSTEEDAAVVDFDHRIAFQVTRGTAPELKIKVYGCRTRKLTRGVKLKAVLGTASLDLTPLLTPPGQGADIRQMTLSIPLTRRSEEEQARVDLHLAFRHNQDAANQTAPWNTASISDRPGGLPVTGPGGAVWVAHPSPLNNDALGEKDHKYGVEDKEELGSYHACGHASPIAHGRNSRSERGDGDPSPQSNRFSDTGQPRTIAVGSGLEGL